jgi:probable rRNA maturation factor
LAADLSDVHADLRPAVGAALNAAGVTEGHLSLELVGPERMRALNKRHRGRDESTDVLAFPLDQDDSAPGPRELGDVVICPALSDDLVEVAVHGTLHLCGFDHDADDGEMLALQRKVLGSLR